MRRLKAAGAIALATLGIAVAAAPADAALTRRQAAYRDITNQCLQYTGCSSISEWYPVQYYGVGGSCAQYRFQFHTTYYGWKYVTTGSYCSPPYAW